MKWNINLARLFRRAARSTSGLVAVLIACSAGHGLCNEDPPIISEGERHFAINDPDAFAWLLFTRLNQAIPGDAAGRVHWEGWALARDVFRDPHQAPSWPQSPIARDSRELEHQPRQQVLRRSEQLEHAQSPPEFDPIAAEGQFNETRMNRAAFDFVVANDLYFVEGQEEFFFRGVNLAFPIDAMETKSQWRRIDATQAARFHTAKTIKPDGTEQLWGLTSLHITTKDLPNWFWATFEHKDNRGLEAVVPSRDSHGLPDSLKSTKWENYVLRGTQTDFVDSFGRPTILANSQIEQGFQRTSSCITCHARSTIGEPPRNGVDVARLEVFEASGDGSVGIPQPSWFVDADHFPATRQHVQLDFVWSLSRARRRAVHPEHAVVEDETLGQRSPERIAPHDTLKQFDVPQLSSELAQVRPLIRLAEARAEFEVDGAGLAVAVLDTGLRTTHIDFRGRVPAQGNFTQDNNNDPNNATDGDGHGTNVGGIIVAGGNHQGIAPGAKIIPLKVLPNAVPGTFEMVHDALQWVLNHHQEHNISVVNLSLGDGGNYVSDDFGDDDIGRLIGKLRERRIAVVVAAGNDFFSHQSQQGMGYPGIFRDTTSVGAVYDAQEGGFTYGDGASANSSAPDQITPFSQRLHESSSDALRTDIFAPGAPVTSSGINTDTGESVQHGTSQASPVTSGVLLLLQQYHHRETGELPTVTELETWLRRGAVSVTDNYGEIDNVTNTGKTFQRIDALGALRAVRAQLERRLLETGQPLRDRHTHELQKP